MAYAPLTADQQATIDAAGKQFDVDPALIAAVYGKESSFGSTVSDPFRSFGLIYGPGEYNGYGYAATTDTFSDAAKTVAAFIANERAAYDKGHDPHQTFLQFYDAIYSPPADNPNSLSNLVSLYKQFGGDPNGEAHYGAAAPPTTGGSAAGSAGAGGDTSSGGGFNVFDPRSWADLVKGALVEFTIGAFFLALIAGGFAIVASSAASSPEAHTAEKVAAEAA